MIKAMTLRERVCMTAVMTSQQVLNTADKMGGLEAYFERYPIGGVFIGGEVIKDPDHAADEVRALVNRLNKASPRPILFHGDFEWGVGQNVKGLPQLTSLLGLAATGSQDLAYEYGAAIADGARHLGAHASYSPVADLNVNPLNQITNVRSAGDQPDQVSLLLRSLVRGMQDGRVSATAKHFPGDGFDFRNQHFVTSINPLDLDTWHKWSGAVFSALIDEGVHMIMAGHIALPAAQRERILGEAPPATLSSELITDLLKGELGFKGVVVSDALIMGGFLPWYEDRRESELYCLAAGCDLLLWPLEESLDYIVEAAEGGRLSHTRLDDAVTRIEAQRAFHGLDGGDPPDATVGPDPGALPADVAHRLAGASIHLEFDRSDMLPLTSERYPRVLLVVATSSEQNQVDLGFTAELLRKHGMTVDLENALGVGGLQTRRQNYDLFFFAFSNIGFGIVDLATWERTRGAVWEALCYAREQTVVVSYGTPYIGEQYFSLAPLRVNAWSTTREAQLATVRCLCGEAPFLGKRPVATTEDSLAIHRELVFGVLTNRTAPATRPQGGRDD